MSRSAVNSEEKEEDNNNHNQEGMLTAPDSLLLPSSEPPDINNWFSSYQYESFVLETNDNFGFSETQFNYGKHVDSSSLPKPRAELPVTNDDQDNNKSDNQVSDSPLLSPVDEESEPPAIENWFSSYAYQSPPLDTMEDLLSHHTVDCNEEQQQRKKGENLNDLICNQTVEEHDNGSTKNSTELPPTQSANLNSPATSLEANENGFVTVKSKREKLIRGNVRRAPCTSSVNDSIKGDDTRKVLMKRKTLTDVTNINAEHLPSVTGKWKCPRKSKPNTGPPLKQLRLGKWFHHQ
ncbi:hypothetical protein CTI12_AA516230 [Artemisia annua]|uniref:Uncharacterized protein n=1 Tax=Artemisia annua TaxID=35608 RepID=A0A2U1L9B6_ARTAN|nr:hypothetical protein CTI12_AA516230 [Artemisia annua]